MAEIAGLKLIVPTSVAGSGVSVSASGKVSFTAAADVSVNGCFTSTYDNYLIVVRSLSNSDDNRNVGFRLRVSGSDATGANYVTQYLFAASTSVSGSRATSQTRWVAANTSSTRESGSHIYIYGPALAQPTAYRDVNVQGSGSAAINDWAGTHSLSTAYDGFSLDADANGAGTFTGALCVYGLSQ